ncbi:MAG: fumarylacetoacetate hydrolase family protein [Chitinophagaceae bacterium]|nr:fumarylacetoacetate hydrolase family protein [Chitinophagaceae bacterium]
MKVYKTTEGIIIHHENSFYLSATNNWDTFINRDNLYNEILGEIQSLKPGNDLPSVIEKATEAPIKSQEIWAAGVTYLRSMKARMEESKVAGGDTFYDKVYDAERPEIFFKATAQRTVGNHDKVRIRKDSTWDVPEPELTLFITSSGKIVGYTIGNDMSSRSIEGENPLYLPQAKMYDGCAALGPCIYVPEKPVSPDTSISISITRNDVMMFSDSILISQMKRTHTELVSFLFREMSFEYGVFLMTGTGIVPPNSFTLQRGDIITISLDNIGTLTNTVA